MQHAVGFAVEFCDHILRRAGRRGEAIPANDFEARQRFRHGRQLGRQRRALRSGYRQRADFAGLGERQQRGRGTEHHRNLAASEIGRRGSRALVRHVDDVDASRVLEQLAGQVQRRADPGRAIGQLAGIGLGIGDQFGDGFDRQIVVHRQHIKTRDRGDDAVEILDRIERQRAVKPGHVSHAAVIEQERVTVRRRFRDFVHADAAAGAAAIIDHDRLAEPLAERIGNQPRDRIDGATRRERHDQADRMRRVVVGKSAAGAEDEERRKENKPSHIASLASGARACFRAPPRP